ncbi:MAG: DoxX family protein [Gammaproteobacteria bacterium]|nr:DoxX family protein [Gammaproteobacteria bacterium]
MITRILSYILALIFFASGGAKLFSLSFEVEAFTRWGYSITFMYFTGILEVLGAIGLLIKRLSSLSAFCLAGLMLGAIGTHIIQREMPMFFVATFIFLATISYAWHGRKNVGELLINIGFKKSP